MENLHEGHRARLKKRFLNEGLDYFEQHQILELMLFSVIPKKDTNPLAHELIRRFGSLAGVLDASFEDLVSVDGIKENAATYLKMFPAVFRVYDKDRNEKFNCYDTLDKIAQFAKTQFVALNRERVYALFLNNRLQIVECYMVSEGTVNSSPVPPRVVMERAYENKASSLVLMHNHPNGRAVASPDDLRLTRGMEQACNIMGVYFLEHLIVAGDECTPILRTSHGYERTSPLTGALDPDFYRNFYENSEDHETTDHVE